jgi:hypothetical protein
MFFPRRTGVELFTDPMSPDAIARAKQALLSCACFSPSTFYASS